MGEGFKLVCGSATKDEEEAYDVADAHRSDAAFEV
jgi:hypothetical protein